MELCRGLACVFGFLVLVGCPAETDGTGAGGSGPSGPECEEDADCPKGECETAACQSGACALTPLEEGVIVDIQQQGDCLDKVCDGAGATTQVANMEDTPNTGGACVTYSCGPSGVEFVFNNGVPCDDDQGYCIENPQDDQPDNFECVECTQNSHCKSMICDLQQGNCSPATCGNNLLDGTETAEDCGGDCPGCAQGLACMNDNDCLSDNCNNDLCAPNN